MLSNIREQGFLSLSRKEPSLFNQSSNFILNNGTEVSIHAAGIIAFTPSTQATKAIVLSCGVHGNETAPIEILDAFVQDLLHERRQVEQRVLFLFGNLPAMDIAERFVEENMNRLFSGAHSQGEGLVNKERVRAKQLEDSIEKFFNCVQTGAEQRFHYDLHTAIRESKNEKFAVYPLLHGRSHSESQLAFLSACGVNTILLSESPTTTFSYFSSTEFSAHAFTVELGKVRPFGENDMASFEAAKQNLIALVCDKHYQAPKVELDEMLIYKVNQVINKQNHEFKLTFDDATPNFRDFERGTVLAIDGEKEYIAEHDGEAIVFPNANVAMGQRALLTVIPTKLEQLDA